MISLEGNRGVITELTVNLRCPLLICFFCIHVGFGCDVTEGRIDMDAIGCTSDKRMSDNESSGFDSIDSSSVDNVPEAATRDIDDEISATTETESDSLTSRDNEQLEIQTLDEEETAVRVNPVQPVQNDDCTFCERNGKFYVEKCMRLKSSNKDRSSMEKVGEYIARNMQIIDVGASIHEQEATALPEGNLGPLICRQYELQKVTPLSLCGRNVTSAAPEGGWKKGIELHVHSQNILAASQRCDKKTATGSREFYRHGTTVCCKYDQVGAAEVHEDHEVAAVQEMGREGYVSRGYEQSRVDELLPKYREEKQRSKDAKGKHNKEEKKKNVLEVPESKEEKESGKIENGKADKVENKAVGQTPAYQKKIIENKVRNYYFSLFSSASSRGENRPKLNYGGHSKKLQKKVLESQKYSLFGHPSENDDRQIEPGKVRYKFQLIDICWLFEYLRVLGI